MRKLFAIAAFVLASSAAQAQYTFQYGGRTIRIDPDRGTVSIPGVYDNSGRKSKRSQDKKTPEQAKGDSQTPDATAPAPAPVTLPPAAAPATASVPPASPPPPTTAAVESSSSDTITSTQPGLAPPALPPLPDQQDVAPAQPAPPPPVVATAPPAPTPAPATVSNPNSPLGLWLTEEKEGKVRIEQCGANLCGYSVDAKTNQNGEQVLLNMKPGKDKWTGRIYDPKSGSTYDSTIALKSQDSLRVQGCALGGMFCGGQTWSRVN
jgi:uncharacterized protein (DUF2147 family)